ncbi:translation initiation factor IF-2-like [Aquila chrysaetos chrysaetos]|uniref:translation initiation factor IF-2-like n=1 Tax=Aquila chrysaetos chrysaetos TaxID=223781 RepID=UPI0011772DF4|nr:translation initiation factor IF-2-like [Aquila chrysaetos chrysaetos]
MAYVNFGVATDKMPHWQTPACPYATGRRTAAELVNTVPPLSVVRKPLLRNKGNPYGRKSCVLNFHTHTPAPRPRELRARPPPRTPHSPPLRRRPHRRSIPRRLRGGSGPGCRPPGARPRLRRHLRRGVWGGFPGNRSAPAAAAGGAGGFPATRLAEPLAGTGNASPAGAGSGPGAGRAAGQPPQPGAGLAALSQQELGRGGSGRGTAPARGGKVAGSLPEEMPRSHPGMHERKRPRGAGHRLRYSLLAEVRQRWAVVRMNRAVSVVARTISFLTEKTRGFLLYVSIFHMTCLLVDIANSSERTSVHLSDISALKILVIKASV